MHDEVLNENQKRLLNLISKFKSQFDKYINLPDLMTLAIMKAFALGRRAKWKDYVDMYFILQKLDLKQIAEKSNKLFLGEFNEKLFREQLSYFEGIDYSEKVEYTVGFEVSDDKIKKFLTSVSLQL